MSKRSDEHALKTLFALEGIQRMLSDISSRYGMDSPWPYMCIPAPPGKCTHVLLPDGWHEVKQGDNGYSQILGSHGLFGFTDPDGVKYEGPTSSMLAIKVERPEPAVTR